jgi:hypothetical protein
VTGGRARRVLDSWSPALSTCGRASAQPGRSGAEGRSGAPSGAGKPVRRSGAQPGLDRLRTACQCCARNLDAAPRRCCAIGDCCDKRLSPLTVAYVHSVLKSALEHAVREEELPRNVARNVKRSPPRHRRFEPLTADEARRGRTATRRTARPHLGRPRPGRRHPQHPPQPAAQPRRRTHPLPHQDPGGRTTHRSTHHLRGRSKNIARSRSVNELPQGSGGKAA